MWMEYRDSSHRFSIKLIDLLTHVAGDICIALLFPDPNRPSDFLAINPAMDGVLARKIVPLNASLRAVA